MNHYSTAAEFYDLLYDAMEAAFNAAGLTVQRKSELLRGLYVGHRHR